MSEALSTVTSGDTKVLNNQKECIQCNGLIDPDFSSFEQNLIRDEHFCRKCFDEIMKEIDLAYLENPRFLTSKWYRIPMHLFFLNQTLAEIPPTKLEPVS